MFRSVSAIVLICAVLGGTPAVNAQAATEDKSPEQLMTEGAKMLMEAMRLFLQSVPQFGEPYINENGDIVIPRLNPEDDQTAPKNDPPDGGGQRGI